MFSVATALRVAWLLTCQDLLLVMDAVLEGRVGLAALRATAGALNFIIWPVLARLFGADD